MSDKSEKIVSEILGAASGGPYAMLQVRIIADDAARILDLCSREKQRNLSKAHVRHLRRIHERDEWQDLLPSPLVFGKGFEILDGQHRLSAQVEAGSNVIYWVAVNAPERLRDVIDGDARPRSLADRLRMGYGRANATPIVAQVRMVKLLETGKWEKLTLLESIEYITGDNEDGIDWSSNVPRVSMYSAAPVMGALAWAHRLSPAKIESFYEQVRTGANLRADAPALALRNWIAVHSRDSREADRKTASLVTCACLHAHIMSRPLKLTKESYTGYQELATLLDVDKANTEWACVLYRARRARGREG